MNGVILGREVALLVVSQLASKGIPFSFEPYPDDQYQLSLKNEYTTLLNKLVVKTNPEDTRNIVLTERQLQAVAQYVQLIKSVPEIHEQWYEDEDTSMLTDTELDELSAVLHEQKVPQPGVLQVKDTKASLYLSNGGRFATLDLSDAKQFDSEQVATEFVKSSSLLSDVEWMFSPTN